MAYRNGTYIAFHAEGNTDPTASDIRYYHMLKAWHERDNIEFKFINSHDKHYAVRDSSKRETLKVSLRARLNDSKNMVLIIGSKTRFDTDWVPFEIAYAVDNCGLPIIAAYPGYEKITQPSALRALWPASLVNRIDSGAAKVIHIPFKRRVIDDAISQYTLANLPPNGLWFYSVEAHRILGCDV